MLSISSSLDSLSLTKGLATIVVSETGEVDFCNAFAISCLDNWPMSIEGNVLTLDDASLHRRLLEELKHVLLTGNPCTFAVENPAKTLPLFISIDSLREPGKALVLVRDGSSVSDCEQRRLRDLYGMTRREVELTAHLMSGNSLASFCETRFLTMNTVKSHLKQVFKKTGVRSQMSLVALTLSAIR